MLSSFKIGKIAGIEIGVHWTWLFIFALITYSMAEGLLNYYYPEWSRGLRWSIGAVIAAVFFGSILLHELSHSLVAKAKGIPVHDITLFVFGGVSHLGREAQSAKEEFQIAIVGPLTSLAIGAFFAALWAVLQFTAPEASAVMGYLAALNAIIGAFNMLPGFPLDGGRVFRSIVWARNRDLLAATRTASRAGEYLAYLLIAAGAVQILFGLVVGGIWMILIALFLRNASVASYEQLLIETTLGSMTAGDVTPRDFEAVPPDMRVDRLVHDYMLAGRGRYFPVMAGEELLGLITLTDVQHLDRERLSEISVFNAMTPFERLHTVPPNEPATALLRMMGEKDVNQVPVVDGRRLVGIVSRSDIIRMLHMRRQIGKIGAAND
jgi:Zn-dependent protease/predicted transcriptional regulator